MNMRLFGERLRKIRIARNIGARELAEAVGLNKTTLYRYEIGYFNSIKESTLEELAKHLSVDKDYLAGKTDTRISLDTLKTLSKKNEKIEIHSIIGLTKDLIKQDNVTLEGKPINNADLNSLIATLEIALEMLKRNNK